jgi:hypothetical protein
MSKSEEPSNHHIEKPEELEAFKKTTEYKKVYHIRHKLQKLVYEKKPVRLCIIKAKKQVTDCDYRARY